MKRPGQVRQHQSGLTTTWDEHVMADANCTRACAHCGGEIQPRINRTTGLPSKAERRYCGSRCKWAASDARRGVRQRERTTKPANCAVCGVAFQSYASTGAPGGWTRCCSQDCARVSRVIRSGAMADRHRIVVRTRHGHCETCGRHMLINKAARYCSDECRPSHYEWQPSVKACANCSIEFVQERKWQACCSDECSEAARKRADEAFRSSAKGRARKKHDKAIRRARHSIEAEPLDPLAVFARDRWKCQLCGKRTPQRLRGQMVADAPELDHIIPLALGGGHTWANVQCACRECNGRKGATAMGQLGLPFAA